MWQLSSKDRRAALAASPCHPRPFRPHPHTIPTLRQWGAPYSLRLPHPPPHPKQPTQLEARCARDPRPSPVLTQLLQPFPLLLSPFADALGFLRQPIGLGNGSIAVSWAISFLRHKYIAVHQPVYLPPVSTKDQDTSSHFKQPHSHSLFRTRCHSNPSVCVTLGKFLNSLCLTFLLIK